MMQNQMVGHKEIKMNKKYIKDFAANIPYIKNGINPNTNSVT